MKNLLFIRARGSRSFAQHDKTEVIIRIWYHLLWARSILRQRRSEQRLPAIRRVRLRDFALHGVELFLGELEL